jgi:hypothetical protein
MKRVVLAALLLVVPIQAQAAVLVITKWTFETSPPGDLTDSATIVGIAADEGTGTASGVHASALTDWSTPAGNGSANSLSATNWAVGDYFQFSASTTGFEDIVLNWAQTSSGTGPGEFTLAYQSNGGGFTNFFDYTVLPNQAGAPGLGAWTTGTEITGYNYSVDLSAVAGLDNAASVDFRLIMRTTADAQPPGAVAAGGTGRVDNFTISGTAVSAVPEPASLTMFGLTLAAGALGGRFRKSKR